MSTNEKGAWKQDERAKRGGWAPGGYMCWCGTCRCTFLGAKLALTCADCAYAQPAVAPEPPASAAEGVTVKLSIGDDVFYKIPGPSPSSGYGTVIGFHPLSRESNLPVLADERALGMPINAAHCTKVGKSCEEANLYREKFLAKFPGKLQDETDVPSAAEGAVAKAQHYHNQRVRSCLTSSPISAAEHAAVVADGGDHG